MTDQTPIGDLLRDALPRHTAPAELRRWAEAQARAMGGDAPASEPSVATRVSLTTARRSTWRSLGIAAGLLFAVALGWGGRALVARSSGIDLPDAPLTAELVDSHVRSLMLDHLVDVRSSDHHTVKPWFLGKADLSPKVPELADAGFPLIGGRMDVVGGRATPVIIYGRRKHFISLYMMRAPTAGADASNASAFTSDRGFHVLSWSAAGVAYRAVSDVAPEDLREFGEAYTAAP
jgi:anti-sigma factor RsiW